MLYYFVIHSSKTLWWFFYIMDFRVLALVSENVDTTGPSVFAICKAFPYGIPGLVTRLPDIPPASPPGYTVSIQQVFNYNVDVCKPKLFSTSCWC